MSCQKCQSQRILSASSHGRDCQTVRLGSAEEDGYLPSDLGIGGGDDLEFELCLDCGQLQGTWPLPTTNLEKKKQVKEKVSKFWTCSVCNWHKNLHIADTCDDCNAPNPKKDQCQTCSEKALNLNMVDEMLLCDTCEDGYREEQDKEDDE